jgi:hypothetical protein
VIPEVMLVCAVVNWASSQAGFVDVKTGEPVEPDPLDLKVAVVPPIDPAVQFAVLLIWPQ